MTKKKYIVYESAEGTNGIIFPAYIEHKKMSEDLKAIKVLGAGFCRFIKKNDSLAVECYGDSHSLSIESRGTMDSIKLSADYLGFKYPI